MGGWHPRPRHYGGGCVGNMFGMILMPIVLILIVLSSLFSAVGSGSTAQGSGVRYDEEKFQDYADAQYAAEFGSSSAYEDNLLITVLVDDDCYEYYYIAWVGDHIVTDINEMMGNNYTQLGQAMNSSINQASYKYSLDSNLAQVMETMTEQITALGLDSAFSCAENHAQVSSHLTNHSALELTEATVNNALNAFTQATGIPAVIVVEDMADVFGRSTSSGNIAMAILLIVLVVLAVIAVVNIIRRRKEQEDGNGSRDSRYHDFDDQY